MELNARIFDLLQKQGKTASELSKYLGISNASVSAWKNEGSYPSSKYIKSISEFLNVSASFLITGQEDMRGFLASTQDIDVSAKELLSICLELDETARDMIKAMARFAHNRQPQQTQKQPVANTPAPEESETPPPTRQLSVYDVPASAGTGVFLDSSDYTIMHFPVSDIPLDATFGVRIGGDSMSPKIMDGHIVLIKQQPTIEDGEVGVFVLNGDSYCKQYALTDGRPTLKSVNPNYAPILIKEDDEVRVVGKVIGSIEA